MSKSGSGATGRRRSKGRGRRRPGRFPLQLRLCLLFSVIAVLLAGAALAVALRGNVIGSAPGWQGRAPLVAGAREHPTTAGYAARIRFGSGEYDTLRVPWGRFGLRLLWKDEAGLPLATLDAARAHLQRLGLHPVMLTNAGIFDTDFAPMGLHVEGGQVLRPLNLADGNGNFFLKPNGVFVVTPERFLIIPSEQFSTLREPVLTATQSGPLLLERGRIHPLFSATSNNRYVRSGVGVRGEREILFAISRNPVTLHEFALLFRDALDCDSALYLDGAISQMDLPALGLSPPPSHFAGILAVVEPLPEEHGGGI